MPPNDAVCSSCGAPLPLTGRVREIVCEFCGSVTVREPEVVEATVIPPQQPRPAPVQPRRPDPRDSDEARRSRSRRHDPNESILRMAVRLVLEKFQWYYLPPVLVFLIPACLFCCGGLSTILGLSGSSRPRARNREEEKPNVSRAQLDVANVLIVEHARNNGELPNDDDGKRVVSHLRDEWGKAVRYELNTTTEYTLRSAGRDGRWETFDDLTERKRANELQVRQVDPEPTNLDEALAYLDSPGELRRGLALAWLLANDPPEDVEQRQQIITMAVRVQLGMRLTSNGKLLMDRWLDSADLETLRDMARDADSQSDIRTLGLALEYLARLGDTPSLLAAINHRDNRARLVAEKYFDEHEAAAAELLEQCRKDLTIENRQLHAVQRIAKLGPSSANWQEIRNELAQMIARDATRRPAKQAMDLLETQVTVEDVPGLLAIYNSQHFMSDRAATALADLKDPRAIKQFMEHLNEPGPVQGRARRALIACGADAESFLWPLLESDQRYQRIQACEILSEIGTDASIPRLEAARDDRPADPAQRAINAIRAAGRAKPLAEREDDPSPRPPETSPAGAPP